MKQKQDFFQMLSSLSFVIVGNFLYALTVKLFLLPSGLVTGGTTGIALTIQHFFGVSVTQFVLAFNVLMLIAGYLILGRQFAATTLASTFLYPFALEIFDHVFGDYIITDDLLLCTIFSGLGIGIALGIVIRSGASTGGMDIPPIIINKKLGISVALAMNVTDCLILFGQVFFSSFEGILYGIITVFVSTIVLDQVILMGEKNLQVLVISAKHQEIADAIFNEINRGCTFVNVTTGYLHEQQQAILCVVSNRQYAKINALVMNIDPTAFIIGSEIHSVKGRGFTLPNIDIKKE